MNDIDPTIDLAEIDDTSIPPALQGCLDRHRTNVARFAQRLRMAGLSEAQIRSGVAMIVDSYKAELQSAMNCLQEQVNV